MVEWLTLVVICIPLLILLFNFPKDETSTGIETLFNWAVWSLGLLVVLLTVSVIISKVFY